MASACDGDDEHGGGRLVREEWGAGAEQHEVLGMEMCESEGHEGVG